MHCCMCNKLYHNVVFGVPNREGMFQDQVLYINAI